MSRPKILAAILNEHGIQVQSIEFAEEGMDHELNITDKVSVQVSALESPYVIVSALVDNGKAFQHWPTRKMGQFDLIETDIRAAIAETTGGAS